MNSYSNVTGRGQGARKAGRRKRDRRSWRSRLPQYVHRISCLGSGGTRRIIEVQYKISAASTSVISLNTLFETNQELIQLYRQYRWVLLNAISVVLYPQEGAGTVKFLMLWTDGRYNSSEIDTSDSTKIFTLRVVHIQKQVYKPPNALLPNTRGDLTAMNYRNWIPTDDTSTAQFNPGLPGSLLVKTESDNVVLAFCLDMVFRGAEQLTSITANLLAKQLSDAEIAEGKKEVEIVNVSEKLKQARKVAILQQKK